MALKAKQKEEETQYTMWTHMENGKHLSRRIHRIEVQARDGKLYTVTGKDLPDVITTSAGEGHKGLHLAQILLKPESIPKRLPYRLPPSNPFPSPRDFVNLVLGFLGALLLQFLLSATILL